MNTVLYTGVTSNLISRVWEHKNKVYPKSSTAKYNSDKLVYYDFHPHIEEAIAAEKIIKGSSRSYKKELISTFNPDWTDLYNVLAEG